LHSAAPECPVTDRYLSTRGRWVDCPKDKAFTRLLLSDDIVVIFPQYSHLTLALGKPCLDRNVDF
jgi:hypothetical protein